MEDGARMYIDAIAPSTGRCSTGLHRLILEAHPDAEAVISYQIPTYKVGRRRLFVGVWKHGVSIYGWDPAATPALPPATPISRRARAPFSCGPTLLPPSPTTNFAT